MKKPTAADIAAKYSRKRKLPCASCKAGTEPRALMVELRTNHGMSYETISRALKGEYGLSISTGALQNHLKNHEAQA